MKPDEMKDRWMLYIRWDQTRIRYNPLVFISSSHFLG